MKLVRGAAGILWLAVLLSGCTVVFGLTSAPSVDRDNDNVEDGADNCADVPNPDQSNFDGDELGDVCDVCDSAGDNADVDADGILDACDGCIGSGEDIDGDRIDDGCDQCIASGVDEDEDEVDDACDACVFEIGVDADDDDIDDACDQCIAVGRDADMDMIDDACDPCVSLNKTDADSDGIEDTCDGCISAIPGELCGRCPPTGCLPCNGATGFDEDGDSHDNACDVCKIVSGATQLTGGDDGVGDDCDASGEYEVELFDGFNAPNPHWYVQGTGWSIENGMARVSILGGSNETYRVLGRPDATFVLRALFELTPSTATTGIFVGDAQGQPASNGMSCAVAVGQALLSTRLSLIYRVNKVNTEVHGTDVVFTGGEHMLVFSAFKEEATCTLYSTKSGLVIGSVSTTPQTPPLSAPTNGGWFAGIAVDGAAVDIRGYSLVHNPGASPL